MAINKYMTISATFVSWTKKHKAEITLVFVALILRVIFFGISFAANNNDIISTVHGDDGYFDIGTNLTNGLEFSGTSTRTPMYPLFIAAIFYLTKSYWVVVLCQIIVGSFIPLLGVLVCRRITDSRTIGLGVGWLLALEPYSILLSFMFYTETVFTVLLLLFLLFLFRYVKTPTFGFAATAALFLGATTLVRPTTQYLPIFLSIGFLWYFRHRLSKTLLGHLAVFLSIFILAITPWLARNYRTFGVIGMSDQVSYNMMIYLVPSARTLEKGTIFEDERINWIINEQHLDQTSISLVTAKKYKDIAIAELKKHPLGTAESLGMTIITFFTHDGLMLPLQQIGIYPSIPFSRSVLLIALEDPGELFSSFKNILFSPAIIVLIGRLFWILTTLLFFYGAWRFLRERGPTAPTMLSLFLVAYFALTTAINGLAVEARFRIPVNALILAFAIYAIASLQKRIKKNHE